MTVTKSVKKYPAVVLGIILSILAVEGGYVSHPDDPGGETNFGITKKTAESHGYLGSMKELPKDVAMDIYASSYITKPSFDTVLTVSEPVGTKLIDAGVNVGTGRVSKWYQQSLNAYSRNCKDYPCIAVDGVIGSNTINTHRKLIRVRGSKLSCQLLLKAIDSYQGSHYLSLTSMGAFTVGWMDHRIGNVKVSDCE